jgi:hypothetical protein
LSATIVELALVVALAALLRFDQRTNTADPIRGAEPARTSGAGPDFSRRDFLQAAGVAGALGISGGALSLRATEVAGSLGAAGGVLAVHAGQAAGQEGKQHGGEVGGHGGEGDVNLSRFDPSAFLRDFYWGEERREGGRTVREYALTAQDVEVEVARG